jgi:hypothetical protein
MAALAVFVSVAAASAARANDYLSCDGYGSPGAAGDGMTSMALELGIFNLPGQGTTERSGAELGVAGVMACDRALAQLPAQFWMRKASLLKARALHRLETADGAAPALADLDLAREAVQGHDDPYAARSLGLSIDLVRALALRGSGDAAAGSKLALETWGRRPFDRQTTTSALIVLGAEADSGELQRVMQGLARLNPVMVDLLYQLAFREGRYADAVRLFSQLSPQQELGNLYASREEVADRDQRNRVTASRFWASRGGQTAYALAALGRPEEALAMLESARARLAKDTQDPPPPAVTPQQDRWANTLYALTANTNLKIRTEVPPIIDSWAREVAARNDVTQGRPEEVIKLFPTHQLLHHWASVELLTAVAAKMPSSATQVTSSAQALRKDLAKTDPLVPQAAALELWKTLPDPETSKRIPAYRKASLPMFGARKDLGEGGDGYSEIDQPGETAMLVRARGQRGTGSITAEMALLRAADLALQSGHKGLIILDRKDVHFTISNGYRTDPNGYETELKVTFVDPSAPPPRFADAPWRVLDAQEIHAALSPLYPPPPA